MLVYNHTTGGYEAPEEWSTIITCDCKTELKVFRDDVEFRDLFDDGDRRFGIYCPMCGNWIELSHLPFHVREVATK